MKRILYLLFLLPTLIFGQNTEELSLNGTWRFFCSGGMNSGKWSNIRVPSQWEQQGFGNYTYGRYYIWDEKAEPSNETGVYRRKVRVPLGWKGKTVTIEFDGVMTDAEVYVNGKCAGPVHQGGFCAFGYDITDKIRFGANNEIVVRVAKQSANESVNAAERRADWWLFGGIYRGVRLTAVPAAHIRRVQVDARCDGALRAVVHTRRAYGCKARLTVGGKSVVKEIDGDSTYVEADFGGVKAWDPEHPNLYALNVELLDAAGRVRHCISERIGFRTVEFRPGDGIYLNGVKLLVKGINRHCFTPEEGRTLSHEQNLEDARLIKQMNMNAVRSHYSPDRDFLNICDSIGLLYFDEFCGWHGRYDCEVGMKLLKEQMASDQNHPCIFMWGNGNEGGWNTALDKEFAALDLQRRHVAHPWQDFNGIDTHHYPGYYTGPGRFAAGERVFMPTEFLHAQYDKGGGAGLEDYWDLYSKSPLCAGGFIWSFSDEAVVRTDLGGRLDTDGPNAPDGVVGPHREKEGSFYAIRDVWSPVQIAPLRITPSFSGDVFVTNSFLFSRLDECRLLSNVGGQSVEIALPPIEPGETAKVNVCLPADWRRHDLLQLDAVAANGDTINSWAWPIHVPEHYMENRVCQVAGQASVSGEGLSANGVDVRFRNGVLESINVDGRVIPLTGGPIPVGLTAEYDRAQIRSEGADAIYTAYYKGDVDSIQWRMRPDGTLRMEAVMLNRKKPEKSVTSLLGLTFAYPDSAVTGMRWMGKGPYRVWKNRQRGQLMGVWHKDYNNTVTGERYEQLVYPEFKGYHANLYWATVENGEPLFTVYTATENIYLHMLTPEEPERRRDGKNTMPKFPEGDISFLYEIPAIGSFRSVPEHGPKSQPSRIRLNGGDEGLHLKLLFDFRPE